MIIRLDSGFEKDPNIRNEVAQELAYNERVSFVVDKSYLFDGLTQIKKFIQILSQQGKISLIVDGNINEHDVNDMPYVYTREETEKLIELNNLLAETNNTRLYFCDEKIEDYIPVHSRSTLLNLNQLIDANEKLNAVVEEIKHLALSPYETMLYIHEYVANVVDCGNGTAGDLNRNATASIMGAYTGEGLVCAGRSSLTKAIIDKLHMPGLSCEYVDASIHTEPDPEQIKDFEDAEAIIDRLDRPYWKSDLRCYKKYGNTEKHRLCLIKLNDEKYGICGEYLNDAHWDNMEHSFAMCCYPVSDVLNLFRDHFVQTKHDVDKTKISKNLEKETAALVKDLKRGKYVPDVVQKYGQNSQPIKISTCESALKSLYLKIYKDEVRATAEVQEHIKNSERVARRIFTNKAANSFVKQLEADISIG